MNNPTIEELAGKIAAENLAYIKRKTFTDLRKVRDAFRTLEVNRIYGKYDAGIEKLLSYSNASLVELAETSVDENVKYL